MKSHVHVQLEKPRIGILEREKLHACILYYVNGIILYFTNCHFTMYHMGYNGHRCTLCTMCIVSTYDIHNIMMHPGGGVT